MAKQTFTFTSNELMKIVFDHLSDKKLIPAGEYDTHCMCQATNRYDPHAGFNFNLYLKKVD